MSQDDSRSLTESQVADYLRNNPSFFLSNEKLVADIALPHPHHSGQAISLVEKQVSVLRDRNREMRQRLSQLLDNARNNDRLFEKTKRLVLSLLDCQDIGDIVDTVYDRFNKEFDIPYTQVILFGEKNIPPSCARIDTLLNAREYLSKRLNSPKLVTSSLNHQEIAYLFQGKQEKIGSAALANLGQGNLFGVLAVGNGDPNHYHAGMGTLFLSFIAEFLSHLFSQHLNKERYF